MTHSESIKSLISKELEQFNVIFDESFETSDPLLNRVLVHLHKAKGKQLRPTLVILAARLCGTINANSYSVAAAFEMLHTASLVHDDIVDNAFERRNRPSVNAKFDNKTAVLVGDYLLTTAMNFVARTRNIRLVDCLVEIGHEITRGELMQLQNAYHQQSEEEYYSVIKRKTAILFAVCSEAGAISVGATKEQTESLRVYGEALGICFQIKDDIFDYTASAEVGKPIFNDIREGKITLPLLYALQNCTSEEHERFDELLARAEFNDVDIAYVSHLVDTYGGIAFAATQMALYREKALGTLAIFGDCPEKRALTELLDFVRDRNI